MLTKPNNEILLSLEFKEQFEIQKTCVESSAKKNNFKQIK